MIVKSGAVFTKVFLFGFEITTSFLALVAIFLFELVVSVPKSREKVYALAYLAKNRSE